MLEWLWNSPIMFHREAVKDERGREHFLDWGYVLRPRLVPRERL
jgi:hypothetical protein